VTPLERLIRTLIADGGPLPFSHYMDLALYHPEHGYYSTGAPRAGWGGDFVTSPELDPAFGQLWARGFERLWERCGRPDGFEVVEIGPGEGALASAVLGAAAGDFADALTYRLVERSPRAADRQRERLAHHPAVTWSSNAEDGPRLHAGCVFANEVLDNVPVDLVEGAADGSVRELRVGTGREGLVLVLEEPAEEVARWLDLHAPRVPRGHRLEVGRHRDDQALRWSEILEMGALVLVDYGASGEDLLRRPQGTLVSYSPAGADDLVLDSPGTRDITAHVNWTSVAAELGRAGLGIDEPRTQREALRTLGAGDVDASLRELYGRATAEGRGADALRALSRRQGLGALLEPAGLGGLEVLTAVRGIPGDLW
jgi:SAM-dependent MidA family methyltransferase